MPQTDILANRFRMTTINRKAQPATCRNCGSATWELRDEIGRIQTLGTNPLDGLAELKAKLARLPTWRVWKHGTTFEIHQRGNTDLASPDRNFPILANHQCNLDFALEHPDYFPSLKYTSHEEPQF